MPLSLGDKLRELRGSMSLREASRKTGLSHTYISQLENGIDPRSGKEIFPSLPVLEQIADGYGIPREELLVIVGYLKNTHENTNEDKSPDESPKIPIDKFGKKSDNSTHEETDNNLDPEWQELYEKVMEKGAKIEATALLRAVAEGKMSKVKLEALLIAFDFIDKKADD